MAKEIGQNIYICPVSQSRVSFSEKELEKEEEECCNRYFLLDIRERKSNAAETER